MTTRRDFAAPVLDRLLTRIIEGESPGLNPSGQPLPPTGDATEVKVWCARRDFMGRDHLNIGDGSNFQLADTRIIVRAEGSWEVGDTFTLEGQRYVVRGVSQLGRSRFLELLARGAG